MNYFIKMINKHFFPFSSITFFLHSPSHIFFITCFANCNSPTSWISHTHTQCVTVCRTLSPSFRFHWCYTLSSSPLFLSLRLYIFGLFSTMKRTSFWSKPFVKKYALEVLKKTTSNFVISLRIHRVCRARRSWNGWCSKVVLQFSTIFVFIVNFSLIFEFLSTASSPQSRRPAEKRSFCFWCFCFSNCLQTPQEIGEFQGKIIYFPFSF